MPSDTIREEAVVDGRAAFDRSDWSAVARIGVHEADAAAPDMVTAVESVELRGVPELASIQRIPWKVGS